MIHTPAELSALIDANHITLHTRLVQVWKDRPELLVVIAISAGAGYPVRCGSSTQPGEHRALLAHANLAIASASAHDRLKIAAALEEIRAGGLGSALWGLSEKGTNGSTGEGAMKTGTMTIPQRLHPFAVKGNEWIKLKDPSAHDCLRWASQGYEIKRVDGMTAMVLSLGRFVTTSDVIFPCDSDELVTITLEGEVVVS
ncbi:MAG: hypothetical protein ACLGIE_07865 [Alphaproteobacteria bacterium]